MTVAISLYEKRIDCRAVRRATRLYEALRTFPEYFRPDPGLLTSMALIGRMHPLLVHIPIAVVVFASAALVAVRRRYAGPNFVLDHFLTLQH